MMRSKIKSLNSVHFEITKAYLSLFESKPIVLKENKEKFYDKFKVYKKTVWKITNEQDLKSLDNYNLRGFKSYHLDHKISIFYGFKNNIPAEVIGSISNLRMIPYKENMRKGTKCDFS